MKITMSLLSLFTVCLAAFKLDGRLGENVSELQWLYVAAAIGVAFLVTMLMRFTHAGRIFLNQESLVVSTPTGVSKIPYSQIESIRRCRRGGRSGHQRLQVIFRSLGERKVLQFSPENLTAFARSLHDRCPHLSSSRNASLVRQSGHSRLVHPHPFLNPGRRRCRETVF